MSAVFPETQSHTNSCPALENHQDRDAQTQNHTINSRGYQTPAMCRTNYPFKAEIVVLAKDFGMTFHSGAHTAVQIHALHTRDQTTQLLI